MSDAWVREIDARRISFPPRETLFLWLPPYWVVKPITHVMRRPSPDVLQFQRTLKFTFPAAPSYRCQCPLSIPWLRGILRRGPLKSLDRAKTPKKALRLSAFIRRIWRKSSASCSIVPHASAQVEHLLRAVDDDNLIGLASNAACAPEIALNVCRSNPLPPGGVAQPNAPLRLGTAQACAER